MAQPEPPIDERSAQFREFFGVLWVRRWSILALTLLGVLVAMFFSFRQTPLYESTARVLVEPVRELGSSPDSVPVPLNLETQREVAQSRRVARLAIDRLDLDSTPEAFLSGLSVGVSRDTEILLFTYEHPDPAEARDRANAVSAVYLRFRREQALDALSEASESIQLRIDELEAKVVELRAQIPLTSSEAQQQTLVNEIGSLNAQITVLRGQLAEIGAVSVGQLQAGQILEPANLPSRPSSPSHPLNAGIGLFGGMTLGIGLAFLRERLDERLRGREDLESQVGAPVLAVVPHVPSWRKKKRTPLVTVAAPRSGAAEAYRTLRTSLLFLATRENTKVIVITSPHPEEGKTATTANLGAALAQAGKRVICVGADLRKPRLHHFFDLDNHAGGLAGILSGNGEPWWHSVVAPNTDHLSDYLRVLPAGRDPGNPSELLASEAMRRLIAQLRTVADFVLLDAPPVLAVSDASILAPLADAVLLVVDAQKTSRGAVSHARQDLEQIDAPLVGAVLNNLDPSKGRRLPHYYRYYYTYGYESREREQGGLTPAIWRRGPNGAE